MISIVGLGTKEGDLTLEGREAILSAKRVLVRTANTRSYKNVTALCVEHETLDRVYEKSRSFLTLHKNLAKAVRDAEREYGDVVYCVDGAAIEDNSAKLLAKSKRVKTIGGVSKVSSIAQAAGFRSCSYTAVSAYEAAEKKQKDGLCAPLIVFDADDPAIASDLKLLLSDCFGEETEVKFIQDGKAKKMKLYEIDRMKRYDYTTAIAIEETEFAKKKRFSLTDLENIIVRLRRPDGCPWDRVQTPQSIKMNAVEEAYELLDAIDSNDPDKILEETGDMLMQVVFHAVLQEEKGEFSLSDVVTGVCDKLIFRHTHVFGGDSASDAQSALSVWDKNKMKEKGQETYSAAVNDVPKCFPALLQAQKIAKRVEKGGLKRSKEELKKELAAFANESISSAEAFGDFLFAAVRLARTEGIDAEEALLEKIVREKRVYNRFEELVIADGKDVNELTETERATYENKATEEVL